MDREKIAAHARGQNMRTQALQKQSAARVLSGKQIAIEHKIERLEEALSSLSKDLNHANTWKNELLKLKTKGTRGFHGSRRNKANDNVDQTIDKLNSWLDAHKENKVVMTKKLRELQDQSQNLHSKVLALNNEATVLFSSAAYFLNM